MAAVPLDELRARTEAARLQTREAYWRHLAQAAWRRGRAHLDAGDLTAAEHELDRARRISPDDGTVLFDLAGVLLRLRAWNRAAMLFEQLAREHDLPDAWFGLAAAALAAGERSRAAQALASGLARAVASPTALALCEPVAAAAGAPGWCGLDSRGALLVGRHPGAPKLDAPLLDGVAVKPGRLPPGWEAGWQLSVTAGGAHLLGSPLAIAAITRLDAFASVDAEGVLRGWAWHPGDPGRIPRLLLSETGAAVRPLLCRADTPPVEGMRPLARPRAIPPVLLAGPTSVTDGAGRHVLGSPLLPFLRARMAASAAGQTHDTSVPLAILAADHRPAARPAPPRRPVSVVVPVHGNTAGTLACLDSLRDTVPRGTPVLVVDDASRDPALTQALDRLARARRIRLLRLPRNLGFPGAANAGLSAAAGRDVVLLNSDTLLPRNWLERLRDAAYSAPDIGTVTPLSDDATILTYRGHPAPVAELDRLAQDANGAMTVDIPTGIGFCLYLRRDCLDATGPLRAELFAQGYGEENDLCFRARALGWRSVAAPGVFVHHAGGRSFGVARAHLMSRNAVLLEQLHPGHDALIADWVARDPLGPAFRAIDALRWAKARRGRSQVFVTHAGGGGVDRVVRDRCAAAHASGLRPIVLRPSAARPGEDGACTVSDGVEDSHPHLRFRLPAELPALLALLRRDRPAGVELHHTLGHAQALLSLPAALRAPYDVVVHDYASFCPRIALVSTGRRYCGEPDVVGCENCIDDLGSLLEEEIGVRALRARSAATLAGARRVVAPSEDAASRLRRHFPGVMVAVQPWSAPAIARPDPTGAGTVRRICVVGAVGMEKGYDVLLACLRDARARALPIEFVLAGYSSDDERLLAAGPLRITGAFRPGEARQLIAGVGAQLAFLPSVWPETWCFALDDCWEAGLQVAAFDLGAPAERIRAAGHGWLLPVNLPPARVNDALLSCSLRCAAVT